MGNKNINIKIDNNSKLLLEKIKSKFILKTILSYIRDENFELKLFKYSNFYKDKLDIQLFDYQNIFFNKSSNFKSIDFINYLEFRNYDYDEIDIKELKNNLKEDLSEYKLNSKLLKKYVIYCCEKFFKENKSFVNLRIDIYSPYFELISNSDIFSKMFICISTYFINKNTNDYISTFNKLNNSEKKYKAISFHFKNHNDVKYLNELNVNFKNIQKFEFLQYFCLNIDVSPNYDIIFKTIFSKIEFANQLTYLNLTINIRDKQEIAPNLIENLNSFNLLKDLKLYGFYFNSIFILKNISLKSIYIEKCKRIRLDENIALNLKSFHFSIEESEKDDYILKFPELEECYISSKLYILDFSSFKNLKRLTIKSDLKFEEIKKYLEQIFTINTLKYLDYNFLIDDKQMLDIQGENKSVTELMIYQESGKECKLYNFQRKFPNVEKICLIVGNKINNVEKIIIKENKNCKINEIYLYIEGNENIQFYCGPYENLVNIEFFILLRKVCHFEGLPIFSDNSNIIFKNLSSFKLYSLEFIDERFTIDSKMFNNLYNNLDKMPNLKHFHLECVIKDLNYDLYLKFVKKLLSKNLEKICLEYRKDHFDLSNHKYYSNKELKAIIPNYKKNDKIKIRKFE